MKGYWRQPESDDAVIGRWMVSHRRYGAADSEGLEVVDRKKA